MARPYFLFLSLSALFFLDRDPISHEDEVQVGTPSLGSNQRLTANHTITIKRNRRMFSMVKIAYLSESMPEEL